MSSKIRIAAIIGSLAALGIILSPVFSLPSLFENPAQKSSGVSGIISEAPIDENAIAPQEISEEDLEECTSISDGIKEIIVSDSNNMNQTIAADLLLGEYCNRPQLVHEISATSDPGIALVAYACDAASGKEGDTELRDSLLDHAAVYCDGSSAIILEEAEVLRLAIEGYREDLKSLEDVTTDNNSNAVTEYTPEMAAALDEIIDLIEGAESLVMSGQHYSAVRMLESASEAFTDLAG